MGKNTLLSKTSLQHNLTPQQLQYLKILQLPITSLENTIKQEIDDNPFLEEVNEMMDDDDILDLVPNLNAPAPDQTKEIKNDKDKYDNFSAEYNNGNYSDDNEISYHSEYDEYDSYDYYDEQWEEDGDFTPGKLTDSDKDYDSFQVRSEKTLYDSLLEQIEILDLSPEDKLIAVYIIGNIDDDGYLRRDISDMLVETNSIIAEHNFAIQKRQYELATKLAEDKQINPAKKYELNSRSVDMLLNAIEKNHELLENIDISTITNNKNNDDKIFEQISIENIEKNIKIVQTLDPPGIASRNLQECLIAQLKANIELNESKKNALMILTDCFDKFSNKHFQKIQKMLNITEDQIKDAVDEIKKLNPKPGGDDYISQYNTIIPDFIVNYDFKLDDFLITINDASVPALKVSPTYENLLKEAKMNKNYNKNTREWMKERYDKAKFFIQAVRQRNISMLMVMTAIVHRQREFFLNDINNLKPMIYQDITNDTTLDVSTVCRVVNDKYVQTSTGVYELKFFFSESLMNDEGEKIATTVIKNRLKEIIVAEPKNKPYGDHKLTNLLNQEGYNVARRTVTKYRETLKIPVARLRREV